MAGPGRPVPGPASPTLPGAILVAVGQGSRAHPRPRPAPRAAQVSQIREVTAPAARFPLIRGRLLTPLCFLSNRSLTYWVQGETVFRISFRYPAAPGKLEVPLK